MFVRTDLLRLVNGWDPECLAEDCELGVRLSTLGANIAVAYDPHMVTREETPGSIGDLIRQRTRWNQGFLQVMSKGYWKALPSRRQRTIAHYTLAQPLLQAFVGLAIPFAILCAFVIHVPSGIALLSFLPAIPTLAMWVFEVAALREFCRVYYIRARRTDYLRLLIGAPFYQLLLSYAAVRAVYRHVRKQGNWEKTAHTGAHRGSQAGLDPESGGGQRRRDEFATGSGVSR